MKKKSLIIRVLRKINHIFFGKPRFKQELLIRKALVEKGFRIRKLKIICDHNLGINYVNGIKLGIKYPDSFYNEAIKLIPKKKPYEFFFNGNMAESGRRSLLLKPFKNLPNTIIISSNEGRIQSKKDQFNIEYFSELAKSKFGLCPHQIDWIGDKEFMWTYRFIECCFVEAIPILFKDAPLGESFINGFNYMWDYQLFDLNKSSDLSCADSENNRLLAKQKFCLTEEECKLINAT